MRYVRSNILREPSTYSHSGDIGYTPADVETFLDYIFTLAHKWGCVLLLDEADVFLAKRQKQDVKHNGLVSGRQRMNTVIQLS